jgi:hypothetical protein
VDDTLWPGGTGIMKEVEEKVGKKANSSRFITENGKAEKDFKQYQVDINLKKSQEMLEKEADNKLIQMALKAENERAERKMKLKQKRKQIILNDIDKDHLDTIVDGDNITKIPTFIDETKNNEDEDKKNNNSIKLPPLLLGIYLSLYL